MWFPFVHFLRKRVVLGVIFSLSLTYCVLNLLRNHGILFDDEFKVTREHPIIWRSPHEEFNITNDPNVMCRNSVQGQVLLVDDRGFVCSRSDLLSTGCCNVEAENTIQYYCSDCSENGCCTIYEHCVSCCLQPQKRDLLEKVLAQASGRHAPVFATVKDQFELCLAKCRTNSHSVQHENKYRNPEKKHCYGETHAHESEREVNSGNVL